MITFAKEVDLENEEAVFKYLKEHPLYWLMNSWNRLRTFAHNIKIYNLNVDKEVEDKLYELLDVESLDIKFAYEDGVNDFKEENPGYTIYTNGRSGGYIILAPNENRSNFCDMVDTINNYDTLDELKEDYEFEEFKDLAKTVMNFDRACDDIIQNIVGIAKDCEIVEEEYTITKTRKVLKFPGEENENEDE